MDDPTKSANQHTKGGAASGAAAAGPESVALDCGHRPEVGGDGTISSVLGKKFKGK